MGRRKMAVKQVCSSRQAVALFPAAIVIVTGTGPVDSRKTIRSTSFYPILHQFVIILSNF